ncbi:hypothetical protein DEJ16_11465 [Curtobacterium sp. MCJR17_055]|nr:hypothetical protein DEJ16_11465 [Curtobacterium sp. MCJR17_055]PYY61150.1 hypothetical protein DEJ26_04615 [Curtobacterium sp. MCPF17_015]
MSPRPRGRPGRRRRRATRRPWRRRRRRPGAGRRRRDGGCGGTRWAPGRRTRTVSSHHSGRHLTSSQTGCHPRG